MMAARSLHLISAPKRLIVAWAAASRVARLPVVDQVVQLIADAVWFGPRSIGQPTVRPVSESEAAPSPAS